MLGKEYEQFKSEKKKQERKSKDLFAGCKQHLYIPMKKLFTATSNLSLRKCQDVYDSIIGLFRHMKNCLCRG